ncbi:uncharacterized protein LAESUDRAFT_718572 [Laetiporus sulphureus 93-53]|uniref:Uncharacterized protein n=1 Tax=Laetiporus sulphureus 93-53 TaxID=1314785 RepID=A0A165AT57_9APHY|nr:uncharacterized protein LAESUDRAFT_718572 [Laetiporus sulphureus 93-53]KZS99612.1 hypothetical protein LAESUDRAFT_718572 [Laetiporus sulphureus 93-53]
MAPSGTEALASETPTLLSSQFHPSTDNSLFLPSTPSTPAMEVDADGEPKDDESVCHSDQDELADDEEASADDSSPPPSAEAVPRKGYKDCLPALPQLCSVPTILAEEKAASAAARLKKEPKELGKKELAPTSRTLKILPSRFNLVTTRTFKCTHINDLEPESKHFCVLPEEPEVTTSSKMKSSKGKKCTKGSAAMSSSRLAATDESLATVTAECDELRTCLSATMSQFNLLLQGSQKMAANNHKFLGHR